MEGVMEWVTYYRCTKAKPGIDICFIPGPGAFHLFGGVFQNVEESLLEAEETDLKDQLLFDDETVVPERIGVYGSARLLNERKFRSDIVEEFVFEVPKSNFGPSTAFWLKRKERSERKLANLEANHHLKCSRTCDWKNCHSFDAPTEQYYRNLVSVHMYAA
jgi:hypothetical protein